MAVSYIQHLMYPTFYLYNALYTYDLL